MLSLFIIFRRGIKIESNKINEDESPSIPNVFSALKTYRKTAATMIAFFVFLLFVEEIGFVISSFSYLIILMYFLGERKFLRMATISITLTVFVYSIFQFWFRVPLPRGLLENYF